MLFEMLDKLCQRINALDPEVEVNTLARHALSKHPGLQEEPGPPTPLTLAFCGTALTIIKSIPQTVENLRAVVDRQGMRADIKTTVLLALTYLVNPEDLIGDESPGGYGYLDDVIVLGAIIQELNTAFQIPQEQREVLKKNLQNCMTVASTLLPPAKRREAETTANSIAALFQMMQQLPETILAIADQSIIDNPLGATPPTNVPGFTPVPTYRLPDQGVRSTMLPGGGYIHSEPGLTSVGFAGGGGVSLVGNTIVPF